MAQERESTSGGRRALQRRIHDLYESNKREAVRFRYALLSFDVAMITFIVVSSFFAGHPLVELIDVLFGIGVLVDFAARLWASDNRRSEVLSLAGLADVVVVVSLLAPLVGESFAFLRVVRVLRVLRSYRLLQRLRRDWAFFRRNENVVLASVHLALFIFLTTALVYESQHKVNPAIANYADALYFTIGTLTTTGFGDITLQGAWGRVLSILIMIFGVTLFVSLIREVFRAPKVQWRCKKCGLIQHDIDAVHCKHCGELLHMSHTGE